MTDAFRIVGSLIAAGGWVMYPLLALSVISLTLTIERTLFWISTNARRTAVQRFADDARHARFAEAAANARQDRSVYGKFAQGLLSGVHPGAAPAAIDSLAAQHAEDLRPSIERFGTTMATITAAAPLLGILGTVLGIIESFRLIGDAGPITDPTTVAAGIATALYTTALGLVVALITLFPHAVFRSRADRCLGTLESLAAAVIAGVAHAADSEHAAQHGTSSPSARSAISSTPPPAALATSHALSAKTAP